MSIPYLMDENLPPLYKRNLAFAGNRDAVTSSIMISPPQVGMVAYNELTHVVQKEVPLLQKLEQLGRISLLILSDLDPAQRRSGLTEFRNFLSKELQVLHFACHADLEKITSEPGRVFSETILNKPFLMVSRKFCIKMDDFVVENFMMGNRPFVILNACVTGTIDPHRTSNWALEFWKRGARGILATEFHVPDTFAPDFIEQIYSGLLEGKPIGEALLAARHHFGRLDKEESNHEKLNNPDNKEPGSPLGLAYALYSRLSIRIANPH